MTIPRSQVMVGARGVPNNHIPGVCLPLALLRPAQVDQILLLRVKVSDRQPKGVRITHVRLVRPQSADPNIGARVKYQGDRATGWKRIATLYLE